MSRKGKGRGGIPSPMRQVSQAYGAISAHGESRHTAKHQLGGAEERIYGHGTRAKYTEHAVNAFRYIRAEFQVARLGDVRQEHVKAYLDHKAKSGDWSVDTYKTARAALNKMAYGVSARGWGMHQHTSTSNPLVPESYKWNGRESNKSSEQQIRPFGPVAGREFLSHLSNVLNAWKGNNINRDGVMTAVTVIRETGMRIQDRIVDMRTEAGRFVIKVKGKGGKIREVTMIRADYIPTLRSLIESARANGREKPTVSDLAGIRGVSERTIQNWVARGIAGNGKIEGFRTNDKCFDGKEGVGKSPHGLRGSWAQEKYAELINKGMSAYDAREKVTNEMGHSRHSVLAEYGIP